MKIDSQARAVVRLVLPEGTRMWCTMLLDQKCELNITATADSEEEACARIGEAAAAVVAALQPETPVSVGLPEDYAETAQ